MKKLLAVFLAVLMLAGMGASAFAEEAPGNGGSVVYDGNSDLNQSIPIQASYQADDPGVEYYVKLEWKGLSFVYHAKSNGKWNPVDHVYDGTSSAYWTSSADGEPTDFANKGQTAGLITVTNNSAPRNYVDVTIKYNKDVSFNQSLDMRFYINTKPGPSVLNASNGGNGLIYNEYFSSLGTDTSNSQMNVYVLPQSINDLQAFGIEGGSISLGDIVVTISKHEITGDPPGPEQPGIEAVTPGPAEEIAANG